MKCTKCLSHLYWFFILEATATLQSACIVKLVGSVVFVRFNHNMYLKIMFCYCVRDSMSDYQLHVKIKRPATSSMKKDCLIGQTVFLGQGRLLRKINVDRLINLLLKKTRT